MAMNKEQAVFLQHVGELIRKAPDFGLLLTGGELYRTPEQQALHIKNGRSKTMHSQHLLRLAIDLNFFEIGPDNSLKLIYDGDSVRHLGAFWESLDPLANRWGGNWSSFKDTPHFERVITDGNFSDDAGAKPKTTVNMLPPETGRGAKLLTDSVGANCRNAPLDVKSLQKLINLNSSRMPLTALLKCDGIIGQKTINAVSEFQKSILFSNEPEMKVRPGDKTLLSLCSVLAAGFNEAVLSIIFLNASDEAIASFAPAIEEVMKRYQINTPLRQAHFLAQIGHESGELRFREELASGVAYENRTDLGNHRPGDGSRYKGRGLIQLTGRANYTEYSNYGRSGQDLEASPQLVASDDLLCTDVAGWFWAKKSLNTHADKDDLETITQRINGGLRGLEDRRRLLIRAKTLLVV